MKKTFNYDIAMIDIKIALKYTYRYLDNENGFDGYINSLMGGLCFVMFVVFMFSSTPIKTYILLLIPSYILYRLIEFLMRFLFYGIPFVRKVKICQQSIEEIFIDNYN